MSEPLHPEVVILNEALEISPKERAAHLDRACAGDAALRQQVEALLRADEQAKGFLETSPAGCGISRLAMANQSLSEKTGDRIGRYKLQEQIGEGGCGVVWLAEQDEPVRRWVALKVIKLGMDTKSVIVRFEAERQALALMDHPNIARVFDAGATETGRPYFVMELVRGVKVTEFCDEHNLSTEARLNLFIQICQAIQHAHQKGIIHRDIKPSNILVTMNDGVPVPKVIDFGIAKATQGRLTDQTLFTAVEQFLGTPAYMSPEQAAVSSVDIDTRSDIYSLGVLLYELLTGRTPFDQKDLLAAGLDKMRRIIREVEPVKPSTRLTREIVAAGVRQRSSSEAKASASSPRRLQERIRQLRGDLDWIAMKCLEKDRSRRYETANGLASDVQRHLNHEPVNARPPGNWYRFRKLARRNKLTFIALTVLAVALMIVAVGSSVAAWRVAQARKAEHGERQKAEAANRQLRATVNLLELERAEDFFRNQDAAQGVAHLSAMLGRNPSDRIAANRMVSALLHRDWMLPTTAPLRHLGPVESVDFSPDGKQVLSASRDGHALIWDAVTGQIIATVSHRDWVLGARYAPDGARFITASRDGTARVWSATNGVALTPPLKHAGAVNCVEFSRDGRWVVTGSADKTAKIWNATTGALRQTLAGHSHGIVAARFSPDAERVFTANENGGQRAWSVETGRTLVQMNIRSPIHSLNLSPDGRRLVTTYDDGMARIWDGESGTLIGEPLMHSPERFPVWQAAFSPDGSLVLTAGEDGTAQIWNVENSQPAGPRLRHAAGAISGVFSRDGKMVVTTSADNSARLWEVRTGSPMGQPMRNHERIVQAVFSSDDSRLATASYAWNVQVWDIRVRRDVGIALRANDDVHSIDFSPDGSLVLGGSRDRSTRVWSARDGRQIGAPLAHVGQVNKVQFSPDGQRFVTVSATSESYVHETSTMAKLAGPFKHEGELRAASFSPDGEHLVTASADGTARVWNARTAEPITPPMTHLGPVVMAQFSPDGRFIASASEDRTARVWDAATGKPVTEPLTHLDHVRWVEFSPDGRRIVTASTDNTAAVWDIATGRRLGPSLQHARIVEKAVFSPDGRRIATASLDRMARIWDASNGQSVTPPLLHEHPVSQICYSPDGRRILTACRNSVRLWDAETGRPLSEWLALKGWIWSGCFDDTGRRIAAGAKNARVWDVPSAPVPVPEWFTAFAESVAGLRLDARGNADLLLWANLNPPAETAAKGGAEEFYRRLADWFVAEPTQRARSPF